MAFRTDIDDLGLKQLYNSGLGSTTIAKQFGCSHVLVLRRLHNMGCEIRKSGGQKEVYKISMNELQDLYLNKKLTVEEIASRFHCSAKTINYRLRKIGCNRDHGDAMLVAIEQKRRVYSADKKRQHAPLKHTSGYILVYKPDHPRSQKNGHIFEHILVWERYHKKSLPKGWVIHHLNGIRDDNRPSNLIAMSRSRHGEVTQNEPYKKRIRQLEIENEQLRQALAHSQMIMYLNEN